MKKQQVVFITLKKYPPLHYKKCQSCVFHNEFLHIDKMIENNFKKLNECFDKSNNSNIALISEDIKQELITQDIIPIKYSNYPIILKRE